MFSDEEACGVTLRGNVLAIPSSRKRCPNPTQHPVLTAHGMGRSRPIKLQGAYQRILPLCYQVLQQERSGTANLVHYLKLPIVMEGRFGSRRYWTTRNLTGEEYEKKRKAVLKYTDEDVARTTEILDKDVEQKFDDGVFAMGGGGQTGMLRKAGRRLWAGLRMDVYEDWREDEAYANLEVRLAKNGDDTYMAMNLKDWVVENYGSGGEGGRQKLEREESWVRSRAAFEAGTAQVHLFNSNRDSVCSSEGQMPSSLPSPARTRSPSSFLQVQPEQPTPTNVSELSPLPKAYSWPLASHLMPLLTRDTSSTENNAMQDEGVY